jgi:hypothetical protein
MPKTEAPSKVLDFNALRAQHREARGEKFLEFKLTPEGASKPEAFRVLRRPYWPLGAFTDGKDDMTVLAELMGEEQYGRLVKAGFTLSDMSDLYDAMSGGDGEPGLGESAGSSES